MTTTPVLIFDDLDSTNAEARRRALAGERGPLWLMARRQTAGRGRRGRAWDSGAGNLAATLLLTLEVSPPQAAGLAFVTGLAVAEMVDAYVPASLVALKWPNDVLIAGRKASGMLIESGPAAGGGLWLAIGVGVNLRTFPTDVERPATALADHLRHDVFGAPTPEAVLPRLAQAMDHRLAQWSAQGLAPILQDWTARAIGLGGPCIARLPNETVNGLAEGLDGDGALLLRLPIGGVRRIAAGDVFFGAP